jgi:hypothetical protein
MPMNENVCRLISGPCNWPECCCGQLWRQWQDAEITPEEYDAAQTVINAMLACVAKRCPNKRARQHAMLQLMHPVFAEEDD